MLISSDIIAFATLISASGAAVTSIINAIRTKHVGDKQDVQINKLMDHDAKLNDVVALTSHAAETLDNHISDEQPLIEHVRTQMNGEPHE